MSSIIAPKAQLTRAGATKARATKEATKIGVLQLRADPALLQEIKTRAGQQRVSANRFVVEAVKAVLKAEKEKEKEQEWRAGFEAMGRDPDTNDVECTLPAAREVLFGERHQARADL